MTDEDRAVWETIRRRTTELAGLLTDASQTPCSEDQSMAVMRALFLVDEARAYFNGHAATRLPREKVPHPLRMTDPGRF